MREFFDFILDDISYNEGRWRMGWNTATIERLKEGYESNGGHFDEKRLRLWIQFDKLGASLYLCSKIYGNEKIDETRLFQYKKDLANIVLFSKKSADIDLSMMMGAYLMYNINEAMIRPNHRGSDAA